MNVFDRLCTTRIVPVIALDDAADAVPLADALTQGGLPIAEITFRTAAARDAIANIAAARPDFLVGAGTVITKDQIHAAKDAGACFALAPGTDPVMIEAAKQHGLPYAPGVSSASDLQIATSGGCRFLKFFPAGLAGGPEMLSAISAPFAHLGLTFNPTGGINAGNMAQWLSQPMVGAIGGSWIATRDDIATGNWASITQKAREALNIANFDGAQSNV